jgi:preprotein translocase subunit SecE
MNNKLKLGAALAVLLGGIYGYYELPNLLGQEVSILIRVMVLLAAVVVAAGVAATSESGAALIEFSKGSRTELRKMVWPSRAETTQTTIIVLILVVVVALFLWLVDALVFNVIYDYLLGVES